MLKQRIHGEAKAFSEEDCVLCPWVKASWEGTSEMPRPPRTQGTSTSLPHAANSACL